MLIFYSEEQTREKTRLKALEDEEAKKIAVELSIIQRKRALACCASLGFTLENTEGINDIKPKALGMKGVEVDFNTIDKGERRSNIKVLASSMRLDLSSVPEYSKAEYVSFSQRNSQPGQPGDFIQLDVGEGQDYESLNYNHKLRRKLRRALEYAEVRKEMLVRQRALDYHEKKGLEAPAILRTEAKPTSIRGQRILENGSLETAKQERVRARMELAEFNARMRVLRRQAKEAAIYAGLRKHAEVTGRIEFHDFSGADDAAEVDQNTDDGSTSAKFLSIGEAPCMSTKRKRSDSESKSKVDATQPQQTSPLSSPSKGISDAASSISSFRRSPTLRLSNLQESRSEFQTNQPQSTLTAQ